MQGIWGFNWNGRVIPKPIKRPSTYFIWELPNIITIEYLAIAPEKEKYREGILLIKPCEEVVFLHLISTGKFAHQAKQDK